jgi:anti-sigma-K factor RskA
MNPREMLPDYVLGLLSAQERLEVEQYLAGSSVARAELASLQQTLVKLSEALPEQVSQSTWQDVQQRLQRPAGSYKPLTRAVKQPWWQNQAREWRNYALAASLMLAVIGFGWALNLQKQLAQSKAEQNKITYWLGHDNIRTLTLTPVSQNVTDNYGTILLLEDGRCLFMLKNPPPIGKSYQVWGQLDGQSTSLAVSQNRLIDVKYTDYETVGVSLEPLGGSPMPTQPLSRVPTW